MKEITKLKRTSLSDFMLYRAELLHTEECQAGKAGLVRAFFIAICDSEGISIYKGGRK